MTNSDDCPDKENNLVEPADEALAMDMLEDLDLSDDDDGLKAGLIGTSPALRAVVAGLKKRRADKARAKSVTPSAIEERTRYRIVKVAEGRGEPRDYNFTGIAPRHHHGYETEAEYKRRYGREYARLRRGVDIAELEAKEYLREVTTPEEKRQAKNQRERNRTAGKSQTTKDAEAAHKKETRRRAKVRAALDETALSSGDGDTL
ncbi:hypothetical protein [Devosia sp. 2618]|uniref:hypothetical protein n=1 Tax=Devosia sp. 2618 TaxID=3156454 RepID=UPI00339695CD